MNTPSALALRRATERDLPALIALARRSWLSAFAETLPATAVRAWAEADRASSWYRTHWPAMTVAELQGVLAGVVQPMDDEINGLWVDPAFQGRGVGTLLLTEGERRIAEAGFRRAWLHCSGRNPRARRFYVARGYRHVRTEVSVLPDGSPEELLVYERPLTMASPES